MLNSWEIREKQIKIIKEILKTTQKSQTKNTEKKRKDNQQMQELQDSFNLVKKMWKDIDRTDEKKAGDIKELEGIVVLLIKTLNEKETAIVIQEQRSPKNYLLLHGVKQKRNRYTY